MTLHIPRFLGHWVATAVALDVTDMLLGGIAIDSFRALVLGSLALAVINALIRPVLVLFTLPVTVLTLGLFLLVVDGLCFQLAAIVVTGFHVNTLLIAMVGALLTGLGSSFVEALFTAGAHPPPFTPSGRPARAARP